jgi:hypothetical protein
MPAPPQSFIRSLVMLWTCMWERTPLPAGNPVTDPISEEIKKRGGEWVIESRLHQSGLSWAKLPSGQLLCNKQLNLGRCVCTHEDRACSSYNAAASRAVASCVGSIPSDSNKGLIMDQQSSSGRAGLEAMCILGTSCTNRLLKMQRCDAASSGSTLCCRATPNLEH